jgi:hypothetical protein
VIGEARGIDEGDERPKIVRRRGTDWLAVRELIGGGRGREESLGAGGMVESSVGLGVGERSVWRRVASSSSSSDDPPPAFSFAFGTEDGCPS